MLPLRDDVPSRGVPLGVVTLAAANAVVFGAVVWRAASPGDADLVGFFETWGLVPREFLRGLAAPDATPHAVWLTPLTAMFLHGGLLHLLGNGVYLWVFGRRIEDLLGTARFLLFYLTCGLAAAAAHVAASPSSWAPAVGASGAISGLLGAYAVSYPTGRLRLLWPPVRVPAFAFLGVWIVIQVAAGVGAWGSGTEGIAWWAHLGGFAAGVVLARPMWARKPTRSRLRI